MARTSEIPTSEPGSVPTMGRGVQLLLLALGADLAGLLRGDVETDAEGLEDGLTPR